nr:MAG TPA: hypothetical protein [Caudoviricetes sp.]
MLCVYFCGRLICRFLRIQLLIDSEYVDFCRRVDFCGLYTADKQNFLPVFYKVRIRKKLED